MMVLSVGGRLTVLGCVLLATPIGIFSPHAEAGWWKDFCERNLIAEDPDQHTSLDAQELISTKIYYLENRLSPKSIDDEIKRRLHFDYELTLEERVLLTTALEAK